MIICNNTMRKKQVPHFIFIAFILLGLLSACSLSTFFSRYILTTQAQIQTGPSDQTSLYDWQLKPYAIADLALALKNTLPSPASEPAHEPSPPIPLKSRRPENLVFFVHGMGNYPEKSLRDQAMQRIQAHYDAGVILFRWPAWINFYTIPRINAQQSGDALGRLFRQLNHQLERSPLHLKQFNRTLLLHSMGAEVIKSFLEHYDGSLAANLFDMIIFAAPEVDLQGHNLWMSKINFSPHVYVLFNPADQVLLQVQRHLGRARLGMQIKDLSRKHVPLATNVVYVDINAGTSSHRSYISRRSKNLAHYLKLLISNQVAAASHKFLQSTPTRNVFLFKKMTPI